VKLPLRLKDVEKSEKARYDYFMSYVVRRRAELNENGASAVKISFKEAVFGTRYWRSTWISFGLMCCN